MYPKWRHWKHNTSDKHKAPYRRQGLSECSDANSCRPKGVKMPIHMYRWKLAKPADFGGTGHVTCIGLFWTNFNMPDPLRSAQMRCMENSGGISGSTDRYYMCISRIRKMVKARRIPNRKWYAAPLIVPVNMREKSQPHETLETRMSRMEEHRVSRARSSQWPSPNWPVLFWPQTYNVPESRRQRDNVGLYSFPPPALCTNCEASGSENLLCLQPSYSDAICTNGRPQGVNAEWRCHWYLYSTARN